MWRRTVRSGCWDCSRRKLRGIAAPVMPSPGYGDLLVASSARKWSRRRGRRRPARRGRLRQQTQAWRARCRSAPQRRRPGRRKRRHAHRSLAVRSPIDKRPPITGFYSRSADRWSDSRWLSSPPATNRQRMVTASRRPALFRREPERPRSQRQRVALRVDKPALADTRRSRARERRCRHGQGSQRRRPAAV